MNLKIKKLNFNYDNFSIKDINLSVESSDILGITGLNGSGKTTLLKIIAGILPSDGVFINEEPLSVKNRHVISYMESDTFLYELLTFDEMLYLVMSICSVNKGQSLAIDEIINILNLNKYRNTLIKELSLGTRQKLSFLLSIVDDPQILLLDEPFNGIDNESIDLIVDILKGMVKEKKKIIILTSHNIELVNNLCNKQIVIEDGNIKQYIKY
ncbi:ABC transporter ATP-binding protein [Clostridium zeae]|uniref:ABC transporter ATP-binding protein n=1 Tax=Clostridium zeae TaxID=2759022 RepID=A0ABQ1EGU9_9CLOT|nr:ABC transporter ATP-binding protein [Clostridium zeae]GFZ34045.1 ABC transporter ATP-binding protein [Clostridium zeae]